MDDFLTVPEDQRQWLLDWADQRRKSHKGHKSTEILTGQVHPDQMSVITKWAYAKLRGLSMPKTDQKGKQDFYDFYDCGYFVKVKGMQLGYTELVVSARQILNPLYRAQIIVLFEVDAHAWTYRWCGWEYVSVIKKLPKRTYQNDNQCFYTNKNLLHPMGNLWNLFEARKEQIDRQKTIEATPAMTQEEIDESATILLEKMKALRNA